MLAQRLSVPAPQASKGLCQASGAILRPSPRAFSSSSSSARGLSASVCAPAAPASRRQFLAASGVLSASVGRGSAVVMSAAASASSQDLLIVGPGVLGSYLGVLWKQAFPGATVTAQTNTTNSHDRWGGF